MERPEGQSQLDYARRLAVELAETARARGRAIQAIGVLGSDLYDKLLLLQALRPRFPQALFFTTDLDARLLHPSENSWARNLLVASSFGLEVPGAEGTRPPYRSNYQTALHFATLHALGRSRTVQEEQAAKAAQVYEVGKTRAILLTGERDSDRWQRDRLLGLMAAAVLLFALWAVLRQIRTLHRRPWWQGLLPHALFLLVVLAFLCLVTQPGGQEPFDLFEGVSIWPSELLRLVAAFLALQLCIKTQRRLRENTRRLCQDLGLAEGLPGPAWGSRGWWRGFHSLFRSDWLSTTESRTVGNLWEQYQTGEKPSQRWTRVAVCSVLYFGFALALVRTFGLPGTPYRGEASWLADRLTLGASVVLLVLLTFLVLDVTLLCERFVRGLVRELNREEFIQSLRELRTGQSGDGDKTRLHPLWRAIDLIAQRTEAVGTPVLYPFVVLLLMILSRSSYFDQWAWSPALIGIWSVNSIFTIVCALILRRTAENARQRVSLRLRQERMIARAADQDSQVKLLDLSVAEVERERRGAFAPLPEQPAVRALLLPLGGIGTAVTLEPLMNLF